MKGVTNFEKRAIVNRFLGGDGVGGDGGAVVAFLVIGASVCEHLRRVILPRVFSFLPGGQLTVFRCYVF